MVAKCFHLDAFLSFPWGWMKEPPLHFFVCFFLVFLFDFDKKDMLRDTLGPAEPKAFAGFKTRSQVSF